MRHKAVLCTPQHPLDQQQQAEDELLIPYNPAAKASAPKVGKTKPDFYEPDTVAAILDAAEPRED